MKTKTVFKCYIRALSPVHLGCDEVYEPMGFVMNPEGLNMVVFEPADFLAGLSPNDKKTFSDICARGTINSILEIYRFLKGKSAPGRRVDVCPGLVDHYHQTLKIPVHDARKIQQELNRFTIDRTAFRTFDQRPFIPGSAIKGALRTAYLNGLNQKKKVPPMRGRFAHKDLEKKLLAGGSFESDPFRLVKVSDFSPVGDARTRVVYAVNEKKKVSDQDARGPYQILETIQPGAVFRGEISVDANPPGSPVKAPASLEDLLKSATGFYAAERQREATELDKIGVNANLAHQNGDSRLLRLGRHSGAECLTIGGHRDIKIMMGRGEKPKFLDHATTLWLCSDHPKAREKAGLSPFGWVGFGEIGPAVEEKLEQEEGAFLAGRRKNASAAPIANETTDEGGKTVEPKTPPEIEVKSAVEKLMDELKLINVTDMGRLGTVIQKIETLETDGEKAQIARAIRDKIGVKKFKKHKKRAYLQGLIGSS